MSEPHSVTNVNLGPTVLKYETLETYADPVMPTMYLVSCNSGTFIALLGVEMAPADGCP